MSEKTPIKRRWLIVGGSIVAIAIGSGDATAATDDSVSSGDRVVVSAPRATHAPAADTANPPAGPAPQSR